MASPRPEQELSLVPSTGDAPEDPPPAAAGDEVNRVVLGFALAPADPEAADTVGDRDVGV